MATFILFFDLCPLGLIMNLNFNMSRGPIEWRTRTRTAGEKRLLVRTVQAHESSDAFEMH